MAKSHKPIILLKIIILELNFFTQMLNVSIFCKQSIRLFQEKLWYKLISLHMNVFAKFNGIPSLHFQDIEKAKCRGWTNGWMDGWTTWKQYTPNKHSLQGGRGGEGYKKWINKETINKQQPDSSIHNSSTHFVHMCTKFQLCRPHSSWEKCEENF